ncbi:hypothetical protein B0J11DRAFT_272035 [Dendryphion nanum]|uniref:Uncharacterized protein n=1 Tax=Dendryphion nanum TaxID=256645 RepID=A0A9P9IMY9_9PLEO|nr:hypothetical protein B0J11DRAFT_272035 [Dendryphion nanum]
MHRSGTVYSFRKPQKPDLQQPHPQTTLAYHCSKRRLSKPPKVQVSQTRASRNRLRKGISAPTNDVLPPALYVLYYEPYPYNSQPGTILGVFSNLNTVTTAAINHGAYTFSRAGMLDGSEYLSPTGRIKILFQRLHRHGIEIPLPLRHENRHRVQVPSSNANIRRSRSRITGAPEGQENEVFLTLHQTPSSVAGIGLFIGKRRAWGACLKAQSIYGQSYLLQNEMRWIDEDNMPRTRARVPGIGYHEWFVIKCRVDDVRRTSYLWR